MRTQVVAGIIENADGKILVAQRPPGKILAGYWEFPGGKIEAGEQASAALKRELREELEVDVEIIKFLGLFPYDYDWGKIDLHVYHVRALGEPRPTESIQTFRWALAQDVDFKSLAAADHEALRMFVRIRT